MIIGTIMEVRWIYLAYNRKKQYHSFEQNISGSKDHVDLRTPSPTRLFEVVGSRDRSSYAALTGRLFCDKYF